MTEQPSSSCTAAAFTPAERALSIGAVVVSSFGVGISYGIGYPLTSLTFEAWGAPAWLTGLAGSMPALAIFLLLPVFPRLVGRLGAVPAMTLGCFVVAAGFLLMKLLPGIGPWIALRFFMGAGLALPWLVGETWINTVTSDAARGRMIALYSIALFSGFAVGPLVLEAVGTTGWPPFLVGAVGVALAAVPIIAAARLAPPLPAHPETGILGVVRRVPAAMAGAFLGGLLEMSHFSLLPNYLLAGGAETDLALRSLTLLMIGGIVLQFPIGWLADRLPRRTLLVGLCLAFAVCALALPAAATPGWFGLVVVFLCGGLLIGFYTVGLAILGERTPPQDLAVANAAFLILYQAGAMIGPTAAGGALTLWMPHGFIAAVVTAALAGAVLSAVAARQPR